MAVHRLGVVSKTIPAHHHVAAITRQKIRFLSGSESGKRKRKRDFLVKVGRESIESLNPLLLKPNSQDFGFFPFIEKPKNSFQFNFRYYRNLVENKQKLIKNSYNHDSIDSATSKTVASEKKIASETVTSKNIVQTCSSSYILNIMDDPYTTYNDDTYHANGSRAHGNSMDIKKYYNCAIHDICLGSFDTPNPPPNPSPRNADNITTMLLFDHYNKTLQIGDRSAVVDVVDTIKSILADSRGILKIELSRLDCDLIVSLFDKLGLCNKISLILDFILTPCSPSYPSKISNLQNSHLNFVKSLSNYCIENNRFGNLCFILKYLSAKNYSNYLQHSTCLYILERLLDTYNIKTRHQMIEPAIHKHLSFITLNIKKIPKSSLEKLLINPKILFNFLKQYQSSTRALIGTLINSPEDLTPLTLASILDIAQASNEFQSCDIIWSLYQNTILDDASVPIVAKLFFAYISTLLRQERQAEAVCAFKEFAALLGKGRMNAVVKYAKSLIEMAEYYNCHEVVVAYNECLGAFKRSK